MKTTLRIVLTLLFCIAFFLCCAPATWADAGDYTIPANTTIIEAGAFSGCVEMKTVTIPAGVTSIGRKAFYGCTGLTDVYYGGTQEQWGQITKGTGNGALTGASIHYKGSAIVIESGTWVNLTWTLDDYGTLTISGTGNMSSLLYDSDAWREHKTDIRSVVISDGLTSIGSEAFRGCTHLQSVTIPDSVKHIDSAAFSDCSSLTQVTFPEGLENIGESCFSGCTSLKKVDLPAGLRSLNGYMDVDGWSNYQTTWGYVFYGCTALKEVTLPRDLEFACYTFSGCTALRTVHFAEGTTVLPDCLFHNCGLQELTLPNSIRELKDGVFTDCENLTAIHLNEGLREIGDSCFSGCTGLTEVELPSTLEGLGGSAFYNCENLTTINIPSGLQNTLSSAPFNGCKSLTNVTIEEGMITIPSTLFQGSGIQRIQIPDSVKHIDSAAFSDCSSLTQVTFPEGLENIGISCFSGCTSLKKVDLPAGLRSLNGYMDVDGWSNYQTTWGYVFSDCTALEEVTLPQNLDYGDNTFIGCTALKKVIMLFPSSVSLRSVFGWSDDAYSFTSSNPNVASVYINSGVVSTNSIGSTNIRAVRNGITEAELTVYVKSGYVDSGNAVASGILREGDEWAVHWMITYDENASGTVGNAQLYLYLEGGNSAVGDLALTSALADETLMPWLTGGYGFQKTSFNFISIQGSPTNAFKIIPDQFSGYNNVRRVELAYVRDIQAEAFYNCTRLQTLVFDSWLTNIGDAAFKNDANLNKLRMSTSFGASIETIGDEAFMNTGLTEFSSGHSLREIGSRAFQNTPLASLNLGKSVGTIGESAFYNTGLEIVRLEKNLWNIGDNAFAGNSDLTILCYRNSAAYEYAENEHISYEFIDNYDDHVVLNGGMYKAENTLTNLSFDWSFDLFNQSANSPSKELAIASLVLAADTYEWDLLSNAFEAFGFENAKPYNYDSYDDKNRVAYGIASKTLDVGGYDTNIIVIACRGSSNFDDWFSNFLQQAQGFRFAANNVREGLDQYIKQYKINTRLPTKLLITGHSRGGAVANVLGTIVPFDDDDVFVYTFASPNTTTDANRFNCDHISNVAVFGDIVPGQPPMFGGDNVFGRTLLITEPVNDNRFIRAFQAITGGLSTVVLTDNGASCISPYNVLGTATRSHAPAVYLACILEPCGSTEGNYGLECEINETATYQATIIPR